MRHSLLRLLVAVGLLFGQALAVAHATQHELSLDAQFGYCDQCVLAHGASPKPHAVSLILAPMRAPRVDAADAISHRATPLRLRPPARAPPFLA